MAEVDIDALRIEIESDAQQASTGLDNLIAKLEKIEQRVQASTVLQNVATQLKAICTAVDGIQGSVKAKLGELAEGLKTLNGVKFNKSASEALTRFTTASSGLSGIDTSGIDLGFFTQLNSTLEGMTGGTKIKNYFTTLEQIPAQLQTFSKTDLNGVSEKVQELANSLSALSQVSAKDFVSLMKEFAKLPKMAETLDKFDFANFAEGIQKIADALAPLGNVSDSVTINLTNLNGVLQQYSNQLDTISKSTEKAEKKHKGLFKTLFKWGAVKITARTVFNALSSVVAKSNKYVEDLNLFTAAMGDYADQAKDYAETVAGIVGIDPADWLRNQGIFQTLATGFGVASDRAYIMSKNITQLGYDISSFFNIDVATAMQKLQSGLSGELEPLRRLGYDLSQARLSAIALSLGIDKAFTSMTQAEKAQLRYYAIMTQVTTAQGDMARTLNAPSNQLRILKAQLEQAGRAIGNIFIPMLNKILPVAIAVMKVIRGIADAIANLLGFELPEIDYSSLNVSGLTDSASDADDALSGANDSAKELKKTILGLDEINPLNGITGSSGSGGAGGSGVGGGSALDFELPEYDFLAGLVENKVDSIFDKIQKGIEWVKDNLDIVGTIVGGILSAVLAFKLPQWFEGLTKGQAFGIGISITGITLAGKNAYDLGYNGFNWEDFLYSILGVGLAGIGGYLAFGATGAIVSIALAITISAITFTLGRSKREFEKQMSDRFGDIFLSEKEIQALVDKKLGSYTVIGDIKILANALVELENAEQAMRDALGQMNISDLPLYVELTVEQKEGYLDSISSWLRSAQDYLDQEQNYLNLNISMAFDDERGAELISLTSGTTDSMKDRLEKKAKELRDYVTEAFNDNILSIDEARFIQQYERQMGDIETAIRDHEFKVEVNEASIEFRTEDFSFESLTAYQEKLQEAIDKNKELAIKVVARTTTTWQERIDAAETEEAKRVLEKGLSDYLASNPVEVELRKLQLESSQAFIDSMQGKFGDEIKEAMSHTETWLPDAMNNFVGEVVASYNGTGSANTAFIKMKGKFRRSFQNSIKSMKIDSSLMTQVFDKIKVEESNYKSVIDQVIEAGDKITDEFRKKVTDDAYFRAVAGDTSAQMYLMGLQILDSQDFANMLGTMTIMGEEIDEELRNAIAINAEFVVSEGQVMIRNLATGVETTVGEATPDLQQYLKDLGFSITEELGNGVEEATPETLEKVGDAMDDIADAFGQGGGGAKKSFVNAIGLSSNDVKTAVIDTIDGKLKGLDLSKYGSDAGTSFGDGLSTALKKITLPRLWVTVSAQTDSRALSQAGWDQRQPTAFPVYAEGGFPDMGEIFVAGEAGPEIVASIRGRSQVMNEGQIAASVASGVASANATQNDLLREQNALLRELLDKDSSVVVTTRDLFNGMERANRRNGYVTVPVNQ